MGYRCKKVKIICMIPARLGSKRVQNKNLRLINGKPLVQYISETASNITHFDKVVINSEGVIFKEIADMCGIDFYQRPNHLASDEATNDDFVMDFLEHYPCDYLVQLLPTSPFLTVDEINSFVSFMVEQELETLVSVSNVQIESLFDGNPINFDKTKQTPPSQLLTPVKAYACCIMGWKVSSFVKNMDKFGAAYHGGNDKVGYFDLKGYSTVDVDNEEDFALAEAVAKTLQSEIKEPEYYISGKSDLIFDANVNRILTEDGVNSINLSESNKEKINISKIIQSNSSAVSWSHTVINSPSNSATLIAQMPGEGNRMHHHPDWDEWWYILEGEWEWNIEGNKRRIKKGDVVFIERNRKHKITATGSKMAIRLAVSRYDVDHVYEDEDYKQNE